MRLHYIIYFQILICTICSLSPIYGFTKPDSSTTPNILIILADDLGYGDLGCYGNKIISTPYLDQLAEEGMRLTDCYASAPMCSPSRAGLLTGRSPYRMGIYDWIAPDSSMYLPTSEITIASLLGNTGYATSHIGKWHLNGKFNTNEQPQPNDHGFDYWLSTQYSSRHLNPDGFVRNGVEEDSIAGYSCQIVADETIKWLTEIRDKNKPFFQFVCFHETHEPIFSPPELVKKYEQYGNKAEYYANVENMDKAVGRIMEALDNLGLSENTFVFFTSDNGPAEYTPKGYFNKSHGSAGLLRGYKRHMFEGGLRVPGIIRWPGYTKPGQIQEQPISNLDLLPTLCKITGVEKPTDRIIDGSDLSPIFEEKKIERETPLHWHFYDPWGGPQSLLRIDNWILGAQWNLGDFHKRGRFVPQTEIAMIKQSKLIDFSLYNIRSDIHQDQNIGTQHPERFELMQGILKQLHRSVIMEAPAYKTSTSKEIFSSIDLFKNGDNGIANYRIPSLITTNKGTLLAVCDARVDRAGDLPNNIDLALRRSTDNGETWSKTQFIVDYPGTEGGGDPAMIVDRETGVIWLFYVYGAEGVGINQSQQGFGLDAQQLMVINSNDDGHSWSEPRNITREVKDSTWFGTFYASGRGLQTRNGRLIVPLMVRKAFGTSQNDHAYLIYSDDHGKSWHTSQSAGQRMGERAKPLSWMMVL